jgi:hypothetical protein
VLDTQERLNQHAVYGPYVSLPRPGLCKAYFRIKVDDAGRPDDVVALDVYSRGNPGPASVKGERNLRGIDFAEPGRYQLFSVPFGCGYEDDLEFRIRPCARGVTISADYVAVCSSAQEQEAQNGASE